jgi:hypothetical protein
MSSLPQPLMISLAMIVGDKLRDSPSEVAFAEGNHPIETLLFDRPNKALPVGSGTGAVIRR